MIRLQSKSDYKIKIRALYRKRTFDEIKHAKLQITSLARSLQVSGSYRPLVRGFQSAHFFLFTSRRSGMAAIREKEREGSAAPRRTASGGWQVGPVLPEGAAIYK